MSLMNTAELYENYILNTYATPALTLVRGQGAYAWDDQDKRYLDLTSGIGVNCLGHCHPSWVKAVQSQAEQLVHTSNIFRHPYQGKLAQKIVEKAGAGRVFFCNSGAEANEALLKLSRLHGIRKGISGNAAHKVIVAENAFHGRTFGSMSATPQAKIQNGFYPLLPTFSVAKYNDLASFESLIDDNTSAILIETIQGESGVTPATDDFLRDLRKLCDKHNLLLLLDEVQCGIGRTGKFFAFQHAGIQPDAFSMAKALGSGFPIGAIWVNEKSADLFKPGMHGTTYGGTPLACVAALATLATLENESLVEAIPAKANLFLKKLNKLKAEHPEAIVDVRGKGLMIGIQFTDNPAPIIAALREKGILVLSAGKNTLRLLPPFIVTADQLDSFVSMLHSILGKTPQSC